MRSKNVVVAGTIAIDVHHRQTSGGLTPEQFRG
jgi:hypothetical protein